MSAISSPASLLTVHTSSTSIQVLSLIRITAGLGAFIAPALFASRTFGFSASKGRAGAAAGVSVGANTTHPGDAAEQSLAIRLFGSRDIALGLLLRDSTAAVVTRAIQVGVISDVLDLVASVLGWVEGNLSPEVATASGGLAAVGAAFQIWVLNRA
ncbi:hypothetical protein T439DRAFT_322737 [Meredithblackwellia eburnea MCA 4105]